jgi:hypothetical protein
MLGVVVVLAAGLLGAGGAGLMAAAVTTTVDANAATVPAVAAPLAPPPAVLQPAGPAPGLAPAAAPVAAPQTAVPAAAARPATAPARKKKPAGLVSGTPCRAGVSACVDLSANRAWLVEDGSVRYGPVPITHGRKGFRTPVGTFRVSYKAADHVSTIYDAEMPYSVFFNDGIAFHQGSLKQLSHGCVHLSGKAAKTFFGALGRGEIVQVVR